MAIPSRAVFVESVAQRPRPPRTADSLAYWEAAHEGRLIIQRCDDCGTPRFYPRVPCSRCWSDRVSWIDASGRGTIYSFTIVHRPPSAGFADAAPYAVALVELEEGVRMMANVLAEDPSTVSVGDLVEVVFERLDDTVTLPQFRLAAP